MSRCSHLLVSLFFLFLFACFFIPSTSSQSALRSLSLNGTNQYLTAPSSTSLNITGAITVEAWIKLSSIGVYQIILSREAFQQEGTGGGYRLTITDTGKLRLDLFQTHNTFTTAIGTTTVTTGAWHHVAGVFDGSQMRVYLDGVMDGSVSSSSGPGSGTGVFYIGRHSTSYSPYYFGGLIDDVRVSAAGLYTSNFTPGLGAGSNVRGLWKFDGQTANDVSGNGNNGTLQNGATYSTDVPAVTNNSPAVSLTHPLTNTTFAGGSNIVMDATASDSDGSVMRVDFYQGTTLLGTDTSAPYTFVWTNVPAGVYSLTAKATDDAGATSTSSAIALTVVNPGGSHSLSLNGTNQYLTAPSSSSLNITGAITVEAWVKLNSIGAYQIILSREAFLQEGTGGGYRLTITDTGKLRFDLFQTHNTFTTVIGTTTMTPGAWRHVAGVFDGNQMRVYVSGAVDGSISTTSGPGSGTGAFYIGRHSTSYSPYYFGGLIDEVRVSAAALYSSNFTLGIEPGSNVRGFWKFDGQTPNDFSGNGNHGTLQNGASYSTDVPSSGGASQRPVSVAGGPYSSQLGQALSFNGSGSFDADGSIAAYSWNFGDGTSANSANPSHTYVAPGLYTATLTVTDNAGLLASGTAAVTISNNGNARLDPLNQIGGVGENPLSQNFNWTLPLMSLPGRGGMDLNLSLSYNSLVWTTTGSYISFDDDRGFPGPGFRLGFPVIQAPYYNSEVAKNAFLLIGSDGGRTELRQVGTSTLYEAADSSYLLLDASTMLLRATDGTQLKYEWKGSEYDCTEVKDRNGNYITVNYNAAGRVDTVVDTLARSIRFNYDSTGSLSSITQTWNQGTPSQTTHNWATFEYTNVAIQTSFSGLTVSGPSNGSTIKTLSRVRVATGAHYDFSYTPWGQIWKITSFAADEHQLNYRAYNLPGSPLQATGPQLDCPRFTERRDWAENFNKNINGSEQEALTAYATPTPESWTNPDGTTQSGLRAQVTAPDGATVTRIYFSGTAGTSSGWRRGLPALVNTYSNGVLQRQVMTTWTQDNTSVSYPLNRRVVETNTYDPNGNRARVQTSYQQVTFANGTSCQLPRDVSEYAANASTVLRSTRTDYNTSAVYTDRRLIGLVSERRLYEGDVNNGGMLMSKVALFYDNENSATSIQGNDAPVQHDNVNYSASFVTGRANVSSVRRYDVANTSQFTTTSSKYNTAGAIVSTTDASNHTTQFSYADSFSDGVSRNTFAYATTVTDPDGYTASAKYHFDFGAVTYKRTPQPNTTQNLPGPEQTFTYDQHGRLQQVTNQVNGAYTRYAYSDTATRVDTYATFQEGLGEAHSFKFTDGAGRVIASATQHPGSVGGYSGQKFIYDVMDRLIQTSNPTETNASGAPSQWATAGDDTAWIYTYQTYDWKGRPLVTTNQDLTTKTLSYSGCGCAGGEVVTVTDEGTLDAGVVKRRQQKIYSDVHGRTIKTEILNWQGGNVYSTVVNTYNARDQVTQIRQYAGAEGIGTYQDTTMTYDGHGRLNTRHRPEQNINAATVWTYNADDTVNTITDARGAVATYAYNARELVTSMTHTLTGQPAVTATFAYDAAGNRKTMIDGLGSVDYNYNLLSQLTSETRIFTGVNSFTLNYSYNLSGQLTSITDPFGASFFYTRDLQGRLKAVTGSPFAGVTNYVTDVAYRAWGAPKSVAYNGSNATITFNERLQPTQYRHTVNGTSASIIRENYSYFADGRLSTLTDLDDSGGTNPPATLRFLSRSYSYDHVGRSTYNQGTGIATMPAVPYIQSYSYDQFDNMTVRSGAYYVYAQSPATSMDNAVYSNNRRTTWGYNGDGQVTSTPGTSTDLPRTITYDAAGRMITTVETGQSGTVTYSAAYDGDGQLVYETSNAPSAPNASYIVRSSVLGGEVLTRLNASGAKLTTHVPAEGLLFARQTSSTVIINHRNPLGITETVRGIYDPLGNYIPFRVNGDPKPPAGTYNSGSMSGLVSSQANAESYGVGCVMDGVPTNCNKVMQAISRDQAKELGILGLAMSPALTRLMASFTSVGTESREVPGNASKPTTIELPDGRGFTWSIGAGEFWTQFIIAPGLQRAFEQNSQKPIEKTPDGLRAWVIENHGKKFQECLDKLLKAYIARQPRATRRAVISRLNSLKPFNLADLTADFSMTQQQIVEKYRPGIIRDGKFIPSTVNQVGAVPDAARNAVVIPSETANNPYSWDQWNNAIIPINTMASNFIHESGNLAGLYLTGSWYGLADPAHPNPFDPDSGKAISDCVVGWPFAP